MRAPSYKGEVTVNGMVRVTTAPIKDDEKQLSEHCWSYIEIVLVGIIGKVTVIAMLTQSRAKSYDVVVKGV